MIECYIVSPLERVSVPDVDLLKLFGNGGC